MNQKIFNTISIFSVLLIMATFPLHAQTYNIVDTGQTLFYNNKAVISTPSKGEAF